MSLFDDVTAQLKEAMLSQDKPRVRALRGIRAAYLEAVKADNRTSLPDDECVTILRRLAKARHESIELYDQGGRDDLAAEERADLAVLEGFLPKLANADTTAAWIAEAIAATGVTSPKEMGKVMNALMAAHKGEVDAKLASALIKAQLG